MVELPLFVRLIPKNLREFKGEIETKIGLGRGRAMAGATAPEIGAMTEVAEEVGENTKKYPSECSEKWVRCSEE